MWKKVNRWAKDNPLTLTIVVLGISFVLQRNTVAVGPLWSGWQKDTTWFILSLGWIVVFGALALLSLNMWAEFDARLRDRRRARGELGREREKERQDGEKEREHKAKKHQLAVKIWQECKDDSAALHDARNTRDWNEADELTAKLAGKLRGLDPYLDKYAFDSGVEWWVQMVGEIIEGRDPSAEGLDRIRTKARICMPPF